METLIKNVDLLRNPKTPTSEFLSRKKLAVNTSVKVKMKSKTTKKRATKKIVKKKTPLELFRGKTKLNARAKKLWVEALRSGKFNQGRERLCTLPKPELSLVPLAPPVAGEPHPHRSYCCLGVLCEVLIQNNFPIEATEGIDTKTPCIRYKFGESNTALYLPQSIGKHIGLNDAESTKLAKMNDGGLDSLGKSTTPKSFKQIAAYIKRYL